MWRTATKHALVAEQLHVSIDEEEQKEYRRAGTRCDKAPRAPAAAPRIQRADVHHFVFQHEKQAVLDPCPLGRRMTGCSRP